MGILNEDRIKELEAKYHLLTDNLIDALWVIDVATMRYEYLSPSVQRISGYTPAELLNVPLKERMTADSHDRITALLKQARDDLARGDASVQNVEMEMFHKEGHTYWVEIRARLTKAADGALKVIGVARDISQRKQYDRGQQDLVDRLNRTIAENEKLNRENKLLRDILPICSGCKRIRDENQRWWPLDVYVERHTRSNFSHTICPDCREVIYGDADA